MKIFKDFNQRKVRLTDERKQHILEHPEMVEMELYIGETLLNPEIVIESKSDNTAILYYRFYTKTKVGGKYLCVVVKVGESDAFVLTAYLTNKVKQGRVIWTEKM